MKPKPVLFDNQKNLNQTNTKRDPSQFKNIILRHFKNTVTLKALIFVANMMKYICVYILTNDLFLECFKKCPQSALALFRINRSALCTIVWRVLNSDWKALLSTDNQN